jgi:Uma2 family endonuclease
MTEAAREKPVMTLDDLMQVDARVEIINGEIVNMAAAGGAHHIVVSNIDYILQSYVRHNKIGSVFPDGLTYLMFSETKGLKDSFVPDVSFICNENIPAGWDLEKPHPGVPDLAIEVISPSESADDIQTKVRTYLEKGAEQVWIVYPTTKEILQYTRDDPKTVNLYTGSQPIDAESLFPGIDGLTTDAIFALPPWAIKEGN